MYQFFLPLAQPAPTDFGSTPVTPEVGGEYVGAVGQVIGALLQTAGVFLQSDILTSPEFNAIFFSAGTLIFVAAILTAIISVSVYGNYKEATYLLIGPALFFFMWGSTVSVQGTMLRFGDRVVEGSIEDQRLFLSILDSIDDDGEHEVSWFFAQFDNIVTQIVQNVVALLISTEFNEDLTLVATERVYSRVLAAEGTEMGFKRLVSQGVVGECSRVNRMAMRIGSLSTEGLHSAERAALQAEYATARERRNVVLNNEVIFYVRSLGTEIEGVDSCGAGALANLNRVRAAVSGDQVLASCDEIWSLACIGSLDEAARTITDATTDPTGNNTEIDWGVVRERVETALEKGASPGQATQLLAAQILKNTTRNTAHGAMTNQVLSRAPFNKTNYENVFKHIYQNDGKGERMSIVAFAAWIPYLQGLLLFILAAGFPFFTLLLLMPNRWQSFFIWMSLWVWVKCWDIGFAVIFFIRQFLWEFMQQGVSAEGDVNWAEPSSIYTMMNQNDPIASNTTYFSIIGLLTIAVPPITAHFCMGAEQLYRVFKQGAELPAEALGTNYRKERRLQDITADAEGSGRAYKHPEVEEYGIRAAQEMAEKLGVGQNLTDENGNFTLENVRTGDGSNARAIRAAYANAKYDFMMNKAMGGRFEQLRMLAASSSGRLDPYTDKAMEEQAGIRIQKFGLSRLGPTLGNPLDPRAASNEGIAKTAAIGAGFFTGE